jgi:hypothetical protein
MSYPAESGGKIIMSKGEIKNAIPKIVGPMFNTL